MKSNRALYLFALFFVIFELNVYLSNDMIMPGMVKVIEQFHAQISDIALSLSLFILGGSLLSLFLAPLSDLVGKRKVMLLGNSFFLVATIAIAFSTSINYFMWGRLFQGMGLCFIFIGYAVIHELFNDKDSIKLISLMGNISIFAPLLGPLIGSIIVKHFEWEYVFIINGILGIISLIGMFKYMPHTKYDSQLSLSSITNSYKKIFTNKDFIHGVISLGLTFAPILGWIGLAPAILIGQMHKTYDTYIVYQAFIISGLIISSLFVQKAAGRIRFYHLIRYGTFSAFLGLVIAFGFHSIPALFIGGMFIYTFGQGLYTGSIIRVSIMITNESTSLTSGAFGFINTIFLALSLELINRFCSLFGYSLFSLSLISFLFGIAFLVVTLKFAHKHKDREWK